MSEGKKSSPWLNAVIVGCVLLVLIGGYVGAYYCMMQEPAIRDEVTGEKAPFYIFPGRKFHLLEDGLDHSEFWEPLFRPMHWLDRQIRPDYWRWPEPSSEPLQL